MSSPTQSDKTVEEILRVVRDAGAWDDNMGGEDWSHSDKSISTAIAALTAREERLVREAFKTRLTEYRGQPLEFYRMMQQEFGDET